MPQGRENFMAEAFIDIRKTPYVEGKSQPLPGKNVNFESADVTLRANALRLTP
jgi:hypothetical protein